MKVLNHTDHVNEEYCPRTQQKIYGPCITLGSHDSQL